MQVWNNKRLLSTGLLLAMLCASQCVWAQTERNDPGIKGSRKHVLEEILVTARKREESAQDIPLAITTLDEGFLEKIGFADLSDLAEKVPSLSIEPFPTSSSTLVAFMRGVGTIDAEQASRDAGVGIYLDDVYLGRANGLAADMADIKRIEVLRGPQGALYGRNTIGGAIKYVTADPSGTLGFKQTLNMGNRGYLRSLTSIDVPTWLGVDARVSYLTSEKEGLVANAGSGDDFGEQDREGYRVSLKSDLADTLLFQYAYDHSEQEGTSLYAQRGGPSATPGLATPLYTRRLGQSFRPVDLPIKDNFEHNGHALRMTWDATPTMTFKSITAYRNVESERLNDSVEAFGLPVVNAGTLDQSQFSQEFLLNGSLEEKRVDYIVGLYYFKETADQKTAGLTNAFALIENPFDPFNAFRPPQLTDLAAPLEADVVNASSAVFGHVTWVPPIAGDQLSVSLGGRYSRDEREMERTISGVAIDTGGELSKDYTSFDPSLTVDYQWSDNVHAYIRLATAYRSGGFNLRAGTSDPFDQEELLAYELGFKSTLWDQRLRLNAAIFRSEYDDIQLDFVNPMDFTISTINASDATIEGVEFELTVLPTDGLELGVDYAYLDADQKDAVIDPFTQQSLEGTSLPHTPRHKYNTYSRYTLAALPIGMLTAEINYSWHDEQTSNGGPGSADRPREDFGLLGARLSLYQIPTGNGDLSVSLWGKNLENAEYQLFALAGADVYGELRSYGVDVIYKMD
ncbi:TonB-dependent receptor [Oceanicoccus sp. KOV_DT_Chl]|uniref:TonB-dependent receptor n=1 Tax=Oceanicoccus sp. KOV_DT_Chl TaxID=1904639 RepID=UPI000C7DFF4E|nr:TonB-dependent receptor [Oceanicoccus sp. KOV_DT_Chl]